MVQFYQADSVSRLEYNWTLHGIKQTVLDVELLGIRIVHLYERGK